MSRLDIDLILTINTYNGDVTNSKEKEILQLIKLEGFT